MDRNWSASSRAAGCFFATTARCPSPAISSPPIWARIRGWWSAAPTGSYALLATDKWAMPCNWKFPAENFGGDAYHVGWSHRSAVTTGFSVGSTASPAVNNRIVSPGNGHVMICIGSDKYGDAPLPEIQAY